jgi:hypothetical protein
LQRSGAAYTGTCNFQFILWDAASAGIQQGSAQSINSVNVVNGLFTVTLDFGDLFTGDARWLGTSVQCSGDGGFTPLDPRQPLTAAPYALSLRPGAKIQGGSSATPALSVVNPTTGYGIEGRGAVGVLGFSTTSGGAGLYGYAQGPGSAAVYAENIDGVAIRGLTAGGGSAIYGENYGSGLAGEFVGKVTAIVTSRSEAILGVGETGVRGVTNQSDGYGVLGIADGPNSAGVFGLNRESAAIWGVSSGVGSAIYGENRSSGLAGRFVGPVNIEGTLTKLAGSFKIDHPLDPANKFLSHSFVESPDMKNIYDGNVITDATGSAIVTLPDYFETLNRDFRYQLTVLGQFAQAIVSRKVAGNSFEIRTDKPGVEVSWQVTGIRQDAYAREHPIVVEEAKPAEEQGMYLYPAGFGAGEEKRLGHLSRPATPQTEQKITKETN